ncbi:MAG: sulfatase-like hydrolase/transferase, partial [Betaproteobacteria bacterium]|nr:sulfatase-like hydrolase/transferase [Betaproteobacteria bacterium]
AWMIANTDKLGGPDTYENYSAGWSWAMNTPLRWHKQMASMLGGVRNGMILSWPGHTPHPGAICSQFSHLTDIAPTLLEAAHLPAPESVYGVHQKPMDGQSLVASLSACDATKPRTQYFEIGGKIGLYHDGWFLSGDDGRPAWEMTEGKGKRRVTWSLYNLDRDFSQGIDLSQKEPERLKQMLELWKVEATRNNVFPIDFRRAMERMDRTSAGARAKHFDYWGKDVTMPSVGAAPYLAARSYTVEAQLILDKPDASGAVLAWGSKFGGWSLYLDHGHPAFAWAKSTAPAEMATIRSESTLPAGATNLRLRFDVSATGAGVILSSDGKDLARGPLPQRALQPSGNGETLDVGRDLGVPVTTYATPFGEIEGEIPHVTIDFD